MRVNTILSFALLAGASVLATATTATETTKDLDSIPPPTGLGSCDAACSSAAVKPFAEEAEKREVEKKKKKKKPKHKKPKHHGKKKEQCDAACVQALAYPFAIQAAESGIYEVMNAYGTVKDCLNHDTCKKNVDLYIDEISIMAAKDAASDVDNTLQSTGVESCDTQCIADVLDKVTGHAGAVAVTIAQRRFRGTDKRADRWMPDLVARMDSTASLLTAGDQLFDSNQFRRGIEHHNQIEHDADKGNVKKLVSSASRYGQKVSSRSITARSTVENAYGAVVDFFGEARERISALADASIRSHPRDLVTRDVTETSSTDLELSEHKKHFGKFRNKAKKWFDQIRDALKSGKSKKFPSPPTEVVGRHAKLTQDNLDAFQTALKLKREGLRYYGRDQPWYEFVRKVHYEGDQMAEDFKQWYKTNKPVNNPLNDGLLQTENRGKVSDLYQWVKNTNGSPPKQPCDAGTQMEYLEGGQPSPIRGYLVESEIFHEVDFKDGEPNTWDLFDKRGHPNKGWDFVDGTKAKSVTWKAYLGVDANGMPMLATRTLKIKGKAKVDKKFHICEMFDEHGHKIVDSNGNAKLYHLRKDGRQPEYGYDPDNDKIFTEARGESDVRHDNNRKLKPDGSNVNPTNPNFSPVNPTRSSTPKHRTKSKHHKSDHKQTPEPTPQPTPQPTPPPPPPPPAGAPPVGGVGGGFFGGKDSSPSSGKKGKHHKSKHHKSKHHKSSAETEYASDGSEVEYETQSQSFPSGWVTAPTADASTASSPASEV